MRKLVTRTLSIPTNGIRLHAEAAGPQDGPLMVLLHGFPEYWAGFANQMGALGRSGLHAVAPDQRGYNLSDKPAGVGAYDVDILARDVLGILDHFQQQQAVIAGHDWGGVVAWQLGMRYPERVSKLIILNAPHPAAMTRALLDPRTGQLARSWYVYAFQIPGLAEATIRASGYRSLKRALQASAGPGTFDREEMARYQQAWRQPGALTGMINWYRAAFRRALRPGKPAAEASRADARRVRVPTLLLWGERDSALSPALAPLSLEYCDQGKLVRFPDATHWLQHDQPERVTHRMLDFVLEG